MILPYYGGFPRIKRRPVTWALVILNVIGVLLSYNFQGLAEVELADFYKTEVFEIQGKLYGQMILDYPDLYSELHTGLAVKALSGNRSSAVHLGQVALADDKFNRLANNYNFRGDQVAVEFWRKNFLNFKKIREEHPNFVYGVSSADFHWSKAISYMFVHAGFSHLAGNMWFLFIVGAMVEGVLGGFAFLMFYLVAGAFSAMFYFILADASSIPLVGASGAISALVGFYSILKWKQKVRFFTVFFIFRWEYLIASLPAWVGLVYWLSLDLAGYLSGISFMGGIAHAAHLGGLFLGVGFGLIYRWRKTLAHGIFRYHSRV